MDGMDSAKKEYDVKVGKRVADLLVVRGMDQKVLAVRIGVTETFMSLALKGKRGFGKESMLKMAKELDVQPIVIMSPDDIPDGELETYFRFMKMLGNKDRSKHYPAIKKLIYDEDI